MATQVLGQYLKSTLFYKHHIYEHHFEKLPDMGGYMNLLGVFFVIVIFVVIRLKGEYHFRFLAGDAAYRSLKGRVPHAEYKNCSMPHVASNNGQLPHADF